VTSLVLPDNSQYTFAYEATPSVPAMGACTPYVGTTCTTGRLASVTLPTGGVIYYSYAFTGCTTGNNGIFPDGSASCLQRTTPDGTWTYTRSLGTGAASTTTVTDPAGNVTTINFQGIYETKRVVNDVSSGVLKTINTCYNGSASPCTGTAITLPIKRRTVIDQYGSSGLQCKHDYIYDNGGLGLLTEQDDYDYGSGAPGAMLRKLITAYASLGNGIVSMPQTVTLCDPSSGTDAACNNSGTVVGKTTSTYDQGTVTSAGAPQHVAVTGSRGNPTTIASLVQGTFTLNRSFTYFDTTM